MAQRIERSVFEGLVREHHGAVYRAALRVLVDGDAARDATQEVFLGLLRDGLPDGLRDVGAVLRHRAVQRAWARLGSERRRRRREERVAMERGEAFEERTVECEDDRRRVARGLAKLPDELRTAVALRFGEGLTFAAIAELCGCSEPTAHDRVRRGLERLQGDLTRAGLAGLVPGLPGLLAAPDPAPVPSGLEATLLALTSAAKPAAAVSLAAGAAWTTAGLAAVALTVALFAPRWEAAPAQPLAPLAANGVPGGRPVDPAAELARTAHTEEGRVATPAGAPPDPGAGNGGSERTEGTPQSPRVFGRLRDGRGDALAGAEVRLVSVERAGKFPRTEERTTSASDGSFQLTGADQVGPCFLHVRAAGHLEHRGAQLVLHPERTLDLGELRLLADSADPPGEFELHIHLVDDAGSPVARALVTLERRVRDERASAPEGGEAWTWMREDSGRSDGEGTIVLHGTRLGSKRARVLPERAEPFAAPAPGVREAAPGTFELDLDQPGEHGRTLVLEPALTIEGRVRTVDGGLPAGDLSQSVVAIAADGGGWFHGRLERDGRFRIGGLAAGPHELRLRLPGLSPLTRADQRPGGAPLELLLKQAHDPRDLGDHDAELHGRAFDARTGELLTGGPFDVFAEPLWGAEAEMGVPELLAHRRLHPRVYQRALAFGHEAGPPDSFAAVGLAPGTYALWVEAHGYGKALVGIYGLAAGELRAGLEARLEAR